LHTLFKRLGIIFLFATFIVSLNGCNEEKAAKKAPVKVAPVFDPLIAKDKASKRIASVDVDAPSLPSGSDYIRLVIAPNADHKTPTRFLSDITSEDSKSVVILAHIENGEGLKLPSVPLFIFEKQAASWSTIFQAEGTLSPLFVAQRAALSASIEIVLLKDHLEGLDKDARELVEAYANRLPLYSKDGAHEISQLADGFASRIALVEEATLKNVANFTISYLENFGIALNLLSASGEVSLTSTLSVTGQTTVLPLEQDKPPQYNALLTHKIGTQSARSALGDLETSFWSVPSDVLHPSCQAIRGALVERLGLSNRDSALVLWRMIQPHALFADGVDYNAQCSGEDVAVLLNEMGLALPQIKSSRASTKEYNAMNKTLSTIASLIKNTKASNEEKLADLMTQNVLVRDQARLLYSDEPNQTIESTTDVIAPTLSKEKAAQYLMSLPIKSYGCYSNGQGQVGNHRATLLTIENDPNLWMMNFAFDDKNKINGLFLGTVDQKDYCRAIGDRLTTNKCVFSGKNFPGLTSAKCG
jgi:hypothetical protein